jgi:L-asparaginase
MSPDLIDASVDKGAKGIVIAGVGNGNMTKGALEACVRAVKKGVVVVRSTRVATGNVGRNVEVNDDQSGTIASADLNPQKSRILLSVALLKQRKAEDIQRLFYDY